MPGIKYLFDIHQTAEEADRLSQQASGSFVFSKRHRFLFSKSQITCGIYRTTTYIINPVAHFSRPLPTLWVMSSERCRTWTIGECFEDWPKWKSFSLAGLSPRWWQLIGSMAGFTKHSQASSCVSFKFSDRTKHSQSISHCYFHLSLDSTLDFDAAHAKVLATVLEVFAGPADKVDISRVSTIAFLNLLNQGIFSPSVQHSQHLTQRLVLERIPQVRLLFQAVLSAMGKHCVLFFFYKF